MNIVSDVIFNDKIHKPDDKLLIKALGPTFKHYLELKDYLKDKYENIREEWKFYGSKYGWQLKIFHLKRNLLFIIPSNLHFKVVLIFGDKAVSIIEESAVKEELKNQVKTARKYLEGRGISIEVKDETYLDDIKSLIEIKKNS